MLEKSLGNKIDVQASGLPDPLQVIFRGHSDDLRKGLALRAPLLEVGIGN